MIQSQQYTRIFDDVLDAISVILNDSRKSMLTHDKDALKQAEQKYHETVRKHRPEVEAIVASREKTELDKKIVGLLPHTQKIGIALENLLNAVRKKVDGNVVFTDKGLNEIRTLSSMISDLAKNANDVIATGNEHLKTKARSQMEEIVKTADEFALEHQERLIEGLCSPRGSYIYLDMVDSLKTAARELAGLAEKA